MSETENQNLPEEEETTTDFKVSDRRKFSPDGELLDPGAPSNEAETTSEPETKEAGTTPDPEQQDAAGQIDFASFMLSLATTALAHLGEVADPATGEKTENLGAAKQMIDILSLLEEKTKGNLEPDEERLLDSLLYELRMKYLNQAKIISV